MWWMLVKTTLEVDDDLWRCFSLLVLRERGGRRKKEVITELIRDYVERKGFTEDLQQLKFILQIEEERESFMKIRDKLAGDPSYKEKYIAIFQGDMVGCEEDKGGLAKKVYEKYGSVPIYIDKVVPSIGLVELPSPELAQR